VKRREFITLVGGAAAWPMLARAQTGGRVRRIALLMPYAEADPEQQARNAGLRQGLHRLGWVEGRTVQIDTRFAPGGPDQVASLAKELTAMQPDVIVAVTTRVTAAFQRLSRTIPIVFVVVSDPVGSGFVESLARPGGNLTGMLNFEASITGKWLAMLKEIAPHLTRVALIANPKTAPYEYFLRTAQAVAPSLGIELVQSRLADADDIERAVASFARAPNGGLVVPPDATSTAHSDIIIAQAAQHRLPAVYSARFFVKAGGLMCYETDRVDMFRRAAAYVDRILRGANPAEIPVQAPTKYETVINIKTANALGLTVPPGMLVAADDVIE
jgi:putative ABC transport system substrate-binding protein